MTPRTSPVVPPSTPRLRIEPTRSPRTLLDGGWWPRSTDPHAELPGLVLAIDLLRGPIIRLVLNAGIWDGNPRLLAVGGRVLRLGYFSSQPASLLTAICLNNERVDLLVVPPETAVDLAEAAMALAATAGNLVHTPQLLTAAGKLSDARVDSAVRRTWEAEGGSLRTAPDARATVASRSADARRVGKFAPVEPAPAPTALRPRQQRTDDVPITTEEQPMTIARHTIISALRRRGQHARADWVERELPERVDTARHAGLLATLRLDPTELAEPTAR
ncbi:hypothetical protein EV384_2923 [Micromonospora kangleipakensis]|uniref:Uncharacterized protein n=1 Tax=Micromonospora kangleipakensis TaxID=1077942 RepID=A0A4Q8B9N5_9ACTN|nr:DUF5994 family protein [Micromonospora kangleipakensis]RZU74457.1 hypothetical protein EV384_2923 [Micromonospora kangleipakensis]